MMIKVVPQAFFGPTSPFPHTYHDGESCILYKCLETPSLQSDYFVSSHVFTLVLQGEKQVVPYDGVLHRIGRNQGVFIPRDLYMIQDILPDQGQFESWLFFFPDDLVQEFLDGLSPKGRDLPHLSQQASLPVIAYDQSLQVYVQSLLPLLQSVGNQQPSFIRLKLMELLHLLASGPKGEAFLESLIQLRPRKRNIRSLMESHFDKALRVEDYALLSGRSLSTFIREFKAAFETTPKQWLMARRMEKAAALLREGREDVTSIALAVGYENLSHFIKAFRDQFGDSPKQYMKAHREAGLF